MPDNKVKDNEIVKALKEYVKENEFEYFHSNTMGEYPLIRKALNFINRLQAQNKDLAETIHNLTIEKDALFDKAEELKAEVDRLQEFIVETRRWDKEIKSEAIEEFATRLKCGVSITSGIITCDDIDNLVKEMIKE